MPADRQEREIALLAASSGTQLPWKAFDHDDAAIQLVWPQRVGFLPVTKNIDKLTGRSVATAEQRRGELLFAQRVSMLVAGLDKAAVIEHQRVTLGRRESLRSPRNPVGQSQRQCWLQ
jgi:hypothetical protein